MCGRVFLVLYPLDTHTQALIAAQPIQGRAGVNHLATFTIHLLVAQHVRSSVFLQGKQQRRPSGQGTDGQLEELPIC